MENSMALFVSNNTHLMIPLITSVEIIPLEIELNETFVISRGPLTHAKITVVKINTDQGLYGIGECTPFRTIYTETQEGTVASGKILAALILSKDATQIRSLIRSMDQAITGNASIKGAFDMALYDLNAKFVGQPLYRYLQGDRNKKIYTDMTVSLLEKDQMVEKAEKYASMGFPVLKIKLGQRPSITDVKRMQAIRNAVGSLPLRIDANQGWNYTEALYALNAMSELNIEHCEAPIFSQNRFHLKSLRDKSPILIMGDESVFSPLDAFQLISSGCIDLINIKLAKSGGICQAMKIASIAESVGMYCQVGSFSETRLGISALVHFSMGWDNITYYDLDSPLMHSIDPIQGGMIYHKDWSVSVDESPGIGADYDPTFLKKFNSILIKQ